MAKAGVVEANKFSEVETGIGVGEASSRTRWGLVDVLWMKVAVPREEVGEMEASTSLLRLQRRLAEGAGEGGTERERRSTHLVAVVCYTRVTSSSHPHRGVVVSLVVQMKSRLA